MGLDAGTRLGPYEILALVGAGEMGDVYKARTRGLTARSPSKRFRHTWPTIPV